MEHGFCMWGPFRYVRVAFDAVGAAGAKDGLVDRTGGNTML